MLNVESRRGDVGERLLDGVAHLLFGGVRVSWPPKGEDVAIPPNTPGDGDRLKYGRVRRINGNQIYISSNQSYYLRINSKIFPNL